MLKLTPCTLFFRTNGFDTPVAEGIETLTVIFKTALVTFDKAFDLGKKLLNWIKIRRVGWQIYQFHTTICTHLRNIIRMMERCVIHHKNGLRFWPLSAVLKKISNEVLEHRRIGRATEDT
jgi:hypothetical protein